MKGWGRGSGGRGDSQAELTDTRHGRAALLQILQRVT